MLNALWLSLMVGAIIISCFQGTTDAVVNSITTSATQAVTLAISLVGVMALWLGLMRIAETMGLIKQLGRGIQPLLRRLFPEVPKDHPAMGAMVLNIAANMLGLGNAATPFGLRAMEQLEKLNDRPGVASNAMCLFLTINTSSVQLVPTTAIAILAASGDLHPTHIILPTLVATTCSTVCGVTMAKCLEKFKKPWILRLRGG